MDGLYILICLLALLALGMPVAFALAITALTTILLFLDSAQLDLFAHSLFASTNHFNLLAIPLFILMGVIFAGSRVGQDLFQAAFVWIGKLKGGLAMCSVVACAIFAGLCGSSAATSAAIGRFAIPEMRSRGYARPLATGAIAAGGTLGILIPPSVTLILYGVATEVSIGQLFLAGVIPGLLCTALFCVYIWFAYRRSVRAGFSERREVASVGSGGTVTPSPSGTSPSGRLGNGELDDRGDLMAPRAGEFVPATPEALGLGRKIIVSGRALPFFALILGVLAMLYMGLATPAEAAAAGALLSVVLVLVVDPRSLAMPKSAAILREATSQTTMVMLIVAFSAILASTLSFLAIPQDLALTISDLPVNKWVILVVINLLLLFLGFFLPPVSIILMTAPILLPVLTVLDFNPIWFGIIMTINMEMGLITPPVGVNLYITKGVSPRDVTLGHVMRGALPYVFVLGALIVLLSVFPELVLWLPNTIHR